MKKTIFNIGGDDIWKRINRFVKYNTYVLVFGLAFTFLFLNYKLSSLADTVEKTLVENTMFIKKNISHPIFLSATGQVITVDKSPMSYYDDRFKLYLINNIADNLISGFVKISGSTQAGYSNAQQFIKQYGRYNHFVSNFCNGDVNVLKKYANAVYLAIHGDQLPEYIDVIDANLDIYTVRQKNGEEGSGGEADISGKIAVKTVVKSWIPAKAVWDTKDFTIYIEFELETSPAKYANIGNPFGLNFKSIDAPAILKPQTFTPSGGRR